MEKPFDLSLLKRTVSQTMGRQILALAINFLITVTIARGLGPSKTGEFSLAMLLSTSISTVLNLGLGSANIYFVSQNTARLKTAFINSFIYWFILSLIGLWTSFYLILPAKENLLPTLSLELLEASIFCIPIFLAHSYIISLLQAMQDFKSYNIVLISAPTMTFFLCTSSFLLFSPGALELYICVVIGYAFSSIIAGARIFFWISNTERHEQIDDLGVSEYSRKAFSYGIKSHLSNVLTLVNYRADIMLIGFFGIPRDVGLYAVAVQIAEKIWIFSSSVSTVILPKLVELNRDEKSRKNLTPKIARITLWVSSAMAVSLMLLAYPTITWLFGTAFKAAIRPFVLLLPGIVFLSFARILANDIASRNKPEFNFFISVIVAFSNILINLILIPKFGLSGASIATTISYLINTILSVAFYSHLSKNKWIDLIVFPKKNQRKQKP